MSERGVAVRVAEMNLQILTDQALMRSYTTLHLSPEAIAIEKEFWVQTDAAEDALALATAAGVPNLAFLAAAERLAEVATDLRRRFQLLHF